MATEAQVLQEESKKAYDITSLNIRLNERTFRLENLQKDVGKTREKINKHEEDMMKITRTLQKQIDEKTETIDKYTMKLQQMEREFIEEQNKLKDRFETQQNDLNKKNDTELNQQEKQMKTLLKAQEQLLEFKNAKLIKKKEIENEANRYKMLLSLQNQVQKQGAEDRERQKQKINAHYAQLLDDFRKNAIEKAEKNISEIEKNIMKQNLRLNQEAQIQEEELAYLDNRNTQLELNNEQAQNDLQQKGLTMEEHAQKQFEKAKKIKLMKTKIELLEKSLGQIVADFEKERELLRFQNEQIIKEQHEELKNLHESIRQKNQEAVNTKAICQMILDQRSDIEQFFHESMEQVKEEKRRQMETEMQAKQSHVQPEFLPLIEPGSKFSKKNYESQQSSTQSQQKITVELNDLDWADRETVLRLLFSKMNTGEAAGSWRDQEAAPSRQQPTRSQGSRPTEGGDLNRGFREDPQTGEDQQQYDDQEYYDQDEVSGQSQGYGGGGGDGE